MQNERCIIQNERYKLGSFVTLLLRRGSEIFLIRRFNTGCEDGMYGCAGGGLDANESVTQAIIREAKEELGIELKKEHLKIVHVVHRKYTAGHDWIGFFIEASEWKGEPRNMEPHKCDHCGWFDINNLPANCQPALTQALPMLKDNIFFSEMGWE